MSKSTRKGPIFHFIFPSEENCKNFKDAAAFHLGAKFVNSPYLGSQPVAQDMCRAYVVGSGSNLFDISLLDYLNKKAEEFGGHRLD